MTTPHLSSRRQAIAYLQAAENALKHDGLERADEHLLRHEQKLAEEGEHNMSDEIYALREQLEDLGKLKQILQRQIERARERVELCV